MRARLAVAACITATVVLTPASSAPAAPCEDMTTRVYDAEVPTWEEVNGYTLGSRQATNEDVERFMVRLDETSDRVETRTLLRTYGGRAMPWALVSSPENLKRKDEIAHRAVERRNAARAAPAVRSTEPAIVWLTAGVHGNEPSATDAHMHALYDLAARDDCGNLQRLERLLVGVLPMQNPDGRAKGQRTNAYRFDLNRDWFARTQPETDAKLDLLERYPPILYVDGHEQAGTAGFFPPNADPIHHEIADEPLRHINDVYGPAMREAFEARGSDYTNYTTYDLFYMGYGDTVPSTLHGAAGMTFEKGGQAPYPEKEADHYSLADTVLRVAADRHTELLEDWARQWRTAKQQGTRGALEPNVVVQPGNTVQFPVPPARVHAYVIRADRHAGDAAALVNRLRAVGVEVDRLRRPLRTRTFRAYGEKLSYPTTLPKNTYLVRMNQSRKHWIQALLGEDAFVPFPYFYDVSGWSNPLLMGLDGGWLTAAVPKRILTPRKRKPLLKPVGLATAGTAAKRTSAPAYAVEGDSFSALALVVDLLAKGVKLERATEPFTQRKRSWPRGTLVVPRSDRDQLARSARDHRIGFTALEATPTTTKPLRAPTVAVLVDPLGTVADVTVDPSLPVGGPGAAAALAQSEGWLRWVLEERLKLNVVRVTEADILAGRLTRGDLTAVAVPDGTVAAQLPGPVLSQIRTFVEAGGTYVGLRSQGLAVAQAVGITSAETKPAPPDLQIPGASVRTAVDDGQPVAYGLGNDGWVFNTGDPILDPASVDDKHVVARYASGDAFAVAGYTEGAAALQGTPVVTDEPVGRGHTVLFMPDATFRAYVEGTHTMLVNALLRPSEPGAAPAAPSPRRIDPSRLATLRHAPAGRTAVVRAGDENRLRAAVAKAGLEQSLVHPLLTGGAELRLPGARTLSGHPDTRIDAVLRALLPARPSFVSG